jgi:predicted nucleic acid-binding protein
LLDVNVLVSLLDSAHAHHDAAFAWFGTAATDAYLAGLECRNGGAPGPALASR